LSAEHEKSAKRSEAKQKSYCFEITAKGQEVIKQNAILNNVLNKVVIKGEAKKDFYKDIHIDDIKNSVLLVDIEGGEFNLFDENLFAVFQNSIIFIELHDWFFEDGESKIAKLKSDAKNTHLISELTTSERDLSKFKELKSLSDTDRWLLCSEGRPKMMTWFRFDPISHI
jgi:hypothetical protein